MQTIYFYKCDGCQEVHQNADNIFKCVVCGEEICTECSADDKCFDYCEPKGELNNVGK